MLIDDGLDKLGWRRQSGGELRITRSIHLQSLRKVVRIETVGKMRASLVSLLLTVLQSLYRTGSTLSIPTMLDQTHQQLALCLPLSTNLCQAYLEMRMIPKSPGSGLLCYGCARLVYMLRFIISFILAG